MWVRKPKTLFSVTSPIGSCDIRARVGFTVKSPQQEAGMRRLPPPSAPCATGTRPAATAAAAPLLEPPGLRSRSHGLRVAANLTLSLDIVEPNSGMCVFPGMTAPAARRRATTSESIMTGNSIDIREPIVIGVPETKARSF